MYKTRGNALLMAQCLVISLLSFCLSGELYGMQAKEIGISPSGHANVQDPRVDFLFSCAFNGDTAILEGALAKADLSIRNTLGLMLLHVAALSGCEGVVALLLDKGAQIDALADMGITALNFAAKKGHVGVVRLLLVRGANVDAVSRSGYTPLHEAIEEGRRDIVELLLERGAKRDALKNGTFLLDFAVLKGHRSIVELLLDRVVLSQADLNGALMLAASGGLRDMVGVLLDRGAQRETVSQERFFTCFHSALEDCNVEAAKLLIEIGADVRACSNNNVTLLHRAAKNGHNEMVEVLLERGAEVGAATQNGLTALHLAAREGHRDVCFTLVGSLLCIPCEAQVASARARILCLLCCANRPECGLKSLPDECLLKILLVGSALRTDVAMLLLKNLAGQTPRPFVADEKLLTTAAVLVLTHDHSTALLQSVYESLRADAPLKRLFEPASFVENFSEAVFKGLLAKIHTINEKAAPEKLK